MKKPQVLSIVAGNSHNGKTTVLCALLPYLGKKLNVGVLKHSHHRLEFSGAKDSDLIMSTPISRFVMEADGEILTLTRGASLPKLEELLASFDHMDLVIIEGYKNLSYPKIEVARRGYAETLYSKPQELIAIVTDIDELETPDVPRFLFGEEEALAEKIIEWYNSNR